jgi:SAM-dependent methyltransferase
MGWAGVHEELDARARYVLGRSKQPYWVFRYLDWDRRRGVETTEIVQLESLQITSPNRIHGVVYIPTSPWAMREIQLDLADLGVRPEIYAFVDFGCGKGRALFLAAEAGYRRVIGVEFAPDLAARAIANRAAYRGKYGDRIEIHEADASVFPIPPGPVVIYMFNPFTGPVLEAVAHNIESSFLQEPRPLYLVYSLPQPDSPFERGQAFARALFRPKLEIFQLRASS